MNIRKEVIKIRRSVRIIMFAIEDLIKLSESDDSERNINVASAVAYATEWLLRAMGISAAVHLIDVPPAEDMFILRVDTDDNNKVVAIKLTGLPDRRRPDEVEELRDLVGPDGAITLWSR